LEEDDDDGDELVDMANGLLGDDDKDLIDRGDPILRLALTAAEFC